jgi:hypothetical protein
MTLNLNPEQIIEALDKSPDLAKKIYEVLRDKYATVEQFNKLLEEIKLSREESNQRFEKMDQRLDEIQAGLGINFEGYNKNVLRTFLEAQGIPATNMIWRARMADPDRVIHASSTEVEIDLFLQEPLILVEVTSIERSLEKVEKFLNIITWLEKKFGQKTQAYYLLFDFEDSIREKAKTMLQTAGVKIISTQT